MKPDLKPYEGKMQKSLDVLAENLAGIRAGRANASVLNKITVDYYGTASPIQQVAAVASPDPRTLTIQPVGCISAQGDCQGNPDFRAGHQPAERWQADSSELPAADRGAP